MSQEYGPKKQYNYFFLKHIKCDEAGIYQSKNLFLAFPYQESEMSGVLLLWLWLTNKTYRLTNKKYWNQVVQRC